MARADELGVDSVLEVLESTLDLQGTQRGREFVLLCPSPKHDDTSPSCSVNLETGYWSCFSCGAGGDLPSLVSMVQGTSLREALALLEPSSPEAILASFRARVERALEEARPATRSAFKPSLPEHKLTPGHPGLRQLLRRGFTEYTLDRWGVTFVPEVTFTRPDGTSYTLRDSVGIPVRDQDGEIKAWCYNRTPSSPTWQPKYLYSYGVDVGRLWFGIQHHGGDLGVTVVEGAKDAMWLDQCGQPAWGLLGSKMLDRHKIHRLEWCRSVTLLPDLDDAGARWMFKIGDQLGTRVPLRVARYAPWMLEKVRGSRRASDPEELMPVDVELALARAVPWLAYASSISPG